MGYDENLSEDISEYFSKSSLNHLLAVSGLHINYISIGILFLLTKLKFPKQLRIIFLSIFLINFMFIIDFSPSVIRAGTMTIIFLISIILYRKNDIKTALSIPILIMLIDNPYKLFNIGLILSYLATIGIIMSTKIINKKADQNKIKGYVFDVLKASIAANILIIPITLVTFNTISFSFAISSIFIGILIGPIVILGFLLIIISFINIKLAYIYGRLYKFLIKILIFVSKCISYLPFSQIIMPTPNTFFIVLYYIFLYILLKYIFLSKNFPKRYLIKKLIKFKTNVFKSLKQNKNKVIAIILINILLFTLFKIIPKDLKIHFIDVGQGDSTLIITPLGKKILIDGGGSESYDIGKNILVPYLLDRGVNKIDYVIISHFDTDHVRTEF